MDCDKSTSHLARRKHASRFAYNRPLAMDAAAVSYDPTRFTACASAIVSAGKKLGAQGLTPATSSNFSMRMDANHAAITISGRDKSSLTLSDIMVIDMDGNAVGTSARPSAETLLHTQIYRKYP